MASKKNLNHVGIDVSAKTLHVAIRGVDGVLEFENTPAGHKQLLKRLVKGGRHAEVVLEATSTYHLDASLLLDAHPRCLVSIVDPRRAHHFHKATNTRAKTDKVDAACLALYAESMPFEPWKRPSEEALQLRSLARYVLQLTKQKAILRAQIHASEVSETTSEWVLKRQHARLAALETELKETQQHLVDQAKQASDIWPKVEALQTIPGVGLATAVRLTCEFLFLDTSMTAKQITAWAGLDPRPRQSGTSVNGRQSISKRGSKRARAILYMPAVAASRMEGPLRDQYQRVRERNPRGLIAMVALMRKLLVVSWAIYRTGQAFDPAKAAPRHPTALAA